MPRFGLLDARRISDQGFDVGAILRIDADPMVQLAWMAWSLVELGVNAAARSQIARSRCGRPGDDLLVAAQPRHKGVIAGQRVRRAPRQQRVADRWPKTSLTSLNRRHRARDCEAGLAGEAAPNVPQMIANAARFGRSVSGSQRRVAMRASCAFGDIGSLTGYLSARPVSTRALVTTCGSPSGLEFVFVDH